MEIVVSGASGLIGTALTRRLERDGHVVRRLVRRPASGAKEVTWDPDGGVLDPNDLRTVEAVVHLAGEGIGEKRWTPEQKRRILESRTRSTALLAETVAKLETPPRVFLSGSAVGYYGDRGDELLTEDSAPGDDFLAGVCVDWENAAAAAVDAGIRVAYLRTGIVLSTEGGALARQLPFFKLGVGGPFGNGRQWMSWISIDDHVAATAHVLGDDSVRGPVNLVGPEPVRNKDFARALGKVLGRPAFLPIPKPAPALLYGRELVDALLGVSQRARPARLEEAGYQFAHGTLEEALRAVLRQDRGS